MSVLTSKQIFVTPPMPAAPPVIPVQFVKPVSYEFRVAEIVDDHGIVEKVKLQVQVWEHDEWGVGNVKEYWRDVPRQRFDKNGTALIS
jgi:hypothetical protein